MVEGFDGADGHRLKEHVAQGGRFDRPGVDRQAAGVRGALTKQGVACAAADEVDATDDAAGQSGDAVEDDAVFEGEAFEDAARRFGLGSRDRLPGFSAELADALRHVAEGGEARVVRVDEGAMRGRLFREADQIVMREGEPGVSPDPAALFEDPESGDVAKQADRSCGADFVRDAGVQGFRRQDRLIPLDADEGPGSAGDIRPVLPLGRDGGDGAGGVVSGGADDEHRSDAGLLGDCRKQRSDDHRRPGRLRHDAHRESKVGQKVGGPAARGRIEALRGAGDRRVGAFEARQAPVKEVRHEKEGRGAVEPAVAGVTVGEELIKRVERHELNSGAGEDLLARDDLKRTIHHAGCARIAVVMRGVEEPVGGVEQSVIHAPGVDPEAVELRAGGVRASQPFLDMLDKRVEIPVKVSSAFEGSVVEAVEFVEGHPAGAQCSQHGAAG